MGTNLPPPAPKRNKICRAEYGLINILYFLLEDMPLCQNFFSFHYFSTFVAQFCCRDLRTFSAKFFDFLLFRCMVAGGVGGCGGMVKEKYGWLHRPKICLRPPSNMKYRHCMYLGSFPFRMAAQLWQSARVLESMCVCVACRNKIYGRAVHPTQPTLPRRHRICGFYTPLSCSRKIYQRLSD